MSKFDRLEALKGTMSKAEIKSKKKASKSKTSKKKEEKAVEVEMETAVEVLEKIIVEKED